MSPVVRRPVLSSSVSLKDSSCILVDVGCELGDGSQLAHEDREKTLDSRVISNMLDEQPYLFSLREDFDSKARESRLHGSRNNVGLFCLSP